MSLTIPSQGTHFSDGVRTGVILGGGYETANNPLLPSTRISTPFDSEAPGIFNTPMSLLDMVPYQPDGNCIVQGETPLQSGYLELRSVTGDTVEVITYQGIPNVIKLDCARTLNLISVSAGTVPNIDIFIWGWDDYGVPLTDKVVTPDGVGVSGSNKAFRYVRAAYCTNATNGHITIGTGDGFGMPYLVTGRNFIFQAMWDNAGESHEESVFIPGELDTATDTTSDVRGLFFPSTSPDSNKRLTINFYNPSGDGRVYNKAMQGSRVLPIDPLTTLEVGTGRVRVVAPNHQLMIGETFMLSGAIGVGGILDVELNTSGTVTDLISDDRFEFTSTGIATSIATGGGGAVFISPAYGGLYRSVIGRFGMPQYSIPLF